MQESFLSFLGDNLQLFLTYTGVYNATPGHIIMIFQISKIPTRVPDTSAPKRKKIVNISFLSDNIGINYNKSRYKGQR